MRLDRVLCSTSLCVVACLVLSQVAIAAQPFAAYHEGFYPHGASQGAAYQEAWYGTAVDLDGDGRAELITGRQAPVSSNFGWVQVRSFGPTPWDVSQATDYFAGDGEPGKVESADLNGDGLLDLLVPVYDTLAVFPGTSPGHFGPRITLPMPGIGGVAAADFDGDGIVDLAITYFSLKKVKIWRGTGAFGFVPGDEFATHNSPVEISAVDLNGDIRPDLVVAADTVSLVLLGDGAGHFTPLDVAANRAESCGDLNGDGHVDLLTTAGACLGNGDGTFRAMLPFPALAVVKAVDLDEDGRLDLVGKMNSTPSRVLTFKHGNGDGTFGAAVIVAPVVTQPTTLAIGDFDGDGHMDVAEPGRNVDADQVHFGAGNGAFLAGPRQVAIASPARYVAAGNFGGDPHPDLLVVSKAAKSMSVLLSNGLASWAAPDSLVLPGTSGARGPALGDLNGDGRDDIVLGYSDLAALSVWLTQPDGHLGARTDLSTVNASTQEIALADLDHDGKLDILYLPSNNPSIGIQWLRGLGGGSFGAPQAIPLNATTGFAVGDFNGDLLPDIAFVPSTGELMYSLATGPGVYGAPVNIPRPVFGPPDGVTIGDFNGDGNPDMVLHGQGGLFLTLGQGGGAFGAILSPDASAIVGNLVLARDLDGDGAEDLVSCFSGQGLKVVRFKPDGSVRSASLMGTSRSGSPLASVAVADVDGNGTLDLVSANSSRPYLEVLLNRKAPQLLAVPPALGGSGLALVSLGNPARGAITLRLAAREGGLVHVELVDLQGRRVRSARVEPTPGGSSTLSLGTAAGLANGIYFARAHQSGSVASTRISVLH